MQIFVSVVLIIISLQAYAFGGQVIYSVGEAGEIYIKSGSEKCQGYKTGVFVSPGSDEVVWRPQRKVTPLDIVCGQKDFDKYPYKICKKPDGSYQDWYFYRHSSDIGDRRYTVIGIDFTITPNVYAYNSRLCGNGKIENSVNLNVVDIPYSDAVDDNNSLHVEIVGPTQVESPPFPEAPLPNERGIYLENVEILGKLKITTPVDHIYPRFSYRLSEVIVDAAANVEIKSGGAPVYIHFIKFMAVTKIDNTILANFVASYSEMRNARKNLIQLIDNLDSSHKDKFESLKKHALRDDYSSSNIVTMLGSQTHLAFSKGIDFSVRGAEPLYVGNTGITAMPHKLTIVGGGNIHSNVFQGDISINCNYTYLSGNTIAANAVIGFNDLDEDSTVLCEKVFLSNSVVSANASIKGKDVQISEAYILGKTTIRGVLAISQSILGDAAEPSDQKVYLRGTHSTDPAFNAVLRSIILAPSHLSGSFKIAINSSNNDPLLEFENLILNGFAHIETSISNSEITNTLPEDESGPFTQIFSARGETTVGVGSKFIGNVSLVDAEIAENVIFDSSTGSITVSGGTFSSNSRAIGNILFYNSSLLNGARITSTGSSTLANASINGVNVSGIFHLSDYSWTTAGTHYVSCWNNPDPEQPDCTNLP